MHRVTTSTTSSAIAIAIPAFAPVLRPPAIGCGVEVEEGEDIMVVGVREELGVCEATSLILSAIPVGAGSEFAVEGASTSGVRVRVLVMSVLVLAMRALAQRWETTVACRIREKDDENEA
jgi:hypothetical protein